MSGSDDEFEVLDEPVVIDCAGIVTLWQFWDRYMRQAEVDGAPSFGRNFYALRDALFGGGPGLPRYREVILVNSQELEQFQDGRFLAALQDLSNESHNGNHFIRLTLL